MVLTGTPQRGLPERRLGTLQVRPGPHRVLQKKSLKSAWVAGEAIRGGGKKKEGTSTVRPDFFPTSNDDNPKAEPGRREHLRTQN